MCEHSDTTESYTFDKNGTSYVKYLPVGVTVFTAGKGYALLDMSMYILQNNSPARIANNTTSYSAEQVV